MASLQFLLYQKLLTSRRAHLIEFNVELGRLSLLGVACICSLENKDEFLLNKCWGQTDPNAVGLFSLFTSTSLLVFTLGIPGQGSNTSPMCPLTAELRAHVFWVAQWRPFLSWGIPYLFPCRSGTSSYLHLSTKIPFTISSQLPQLIPLSTWCGLEVLCYFCKFYIESCTNSELSIFLCFGTSVNISNLILYYTIFM